MRNHFFCAIVLCGLTTAPLQANLLENGEFSLWDSSTQPAGWIVEDSSKARIEQSADTIHSSPYACRITRLVTGTGNNYGVRQFVPVTPGRVYTFSAWFFDDEVNARGGLVITWCRGDSSAIRSTTVAYTDSSIHTWQHLVKTDTAPDSTVYAKCMLRIYGFTGGPAGGVVYCDDAEFVEGVGSITENDALVGKGFRINTRTIRSRRDVLINLQSDKAINGRLSICNIRGEECFSFGESRISPGSNVFFWRGLDRNGRTLPAGVYFIRLQVNVNSESWVNKVMLL